MQQKKILKLEKNKDSLSKNSRDIFSKEIEKFSSACKTLINKKETVSKSQINDSICVSDFIDDDNFTNTVEFISKRCKEMIQSKIKPVSKNLY